MSVNFPRAWQIARSVPISTHNSKCSYFISKGGILCDCEVLTTNLEYTNNMLLYGRDGVVLAPPSIRHSQPSTKK